MGDADHGFDTGRGGHRPLDFIFDDLVRFGEALRNVADFRFLDQHRIRLFRGGVQTDRLAQDFGRIGPQRFLHIENEGPFLPLCLYQSQRPIAYLLAVRDNRDSHGMLIEIADTRKSEDIIFTGAGAARDVVKNDIRIVVPEHVSHAVQDSRVAGVYAGDSCVRVRRSHDFCEQHPGKAYISGVHSFSAHPVIPVLADHIAPHFR